MKMKISQFGKARKMILSKQSILMVLALMVVVAGVINWNIRGNDSFIKTSTKDIPIKGQLSEDEIYGDSIETDITDDFFTTQRIDNENSKNKELEINNEILNNANSSKESKLKAEQEIARIAKSIESENASVGLIRAKGYEDALVVIGQDVATVIVKCPKLEAQDVAVIKDIIVGQTGYTADMIKISEMK